jgi:hypothetical protein
MFFLSYRFADSRGIVFKEPNLTSHSFFAELWNGTTQVSGFSFGMRLLNPYTMIFYPSNIASSTVNSGIMTGAYTIRLINLNSSDPLNPVFSNLSTSVYFITRLNNPAITNLTLIYPKRIHV